MTRKIRGMGWKPQLPDHRDHKYHLCHTIHATLPDKVDLRPQCPGVYDQGDLGSCTANALGALAQFVMMKEGHAAFAPSRLFIYYNERVIENSVNEDSGAEIRDGMKVLAQQGAPHESLWWYNTAKFAVKPNRGVYSDGLRHLISNYSALGSAAEYKSCLADGYPVVFGFTVYESFESNAVAANGIVPMPGKNEQTVGGHAVMLVGYDESRQMYIVRNSWGTGWGVKGYFYMPYAYVENNDLSSDFWTARIVA